ncbi:MAG: glutathione S-transferase C-terminal domain-containing protein, partial [Methylocystis sp.]|nr:glutathione S-transferase C-terminal domain-containing protein [Methylocystis sp.]
TNLRVAGYLGAEMKQTPASLEEWRRHWFLKGGLEAIERLIEPGPFCFGARPTLADVCLIPQLYSARRFATPLEHLPKILGVEAACAALPAFRAAHPSAQADAE